MGHFEIDKQPRHGWRIVAALFVCAFMIYGAGMYSFMLFVPILAERFDWGPAAAGSLVSAFWVAAPLSLVANRLIRHIGIKGLITGGIGIEAVALACIFLPSHFWEVYLLRTLAGLGKVCFAIALPLILSKWFSDRFGTAIAIVYCGMFVSGTVFAPVTHALIASLGVEGASVTLALAVLVIALPLALWVLRVGAFAPRHSGASDASAKPGPGSAAEATAVRGLWWDRDLQAIAVSRTVYYAVMAGPFVYQTAIMEVNGGATATASVLLGFTAAFIGAGELLSGYLVDRLAWTQAMLVQYLLFGVGLAAMLVFAAIPSLWILVLYAACFGLAYGGSDPFWTTTLRRKLDPALFQRAWGPIYFLGLAVSVLWPICFGWLRDVTGSYTVPLATSVALLIVPLVLSLIRGKVSQG